jgi:hypothetical protein
MTTIPTNLHQAAAQLRDVRHKASPFVEKFARFGYAAKGVVYVLLGALAAMAALGHADGEVTGSKGVMQTLGQHPFGMILLGIVALGLAGYALWQFIRAIEDPENEGSDGKAIAKRAGFFGSGIIHVGLTVYAIGIVIGARAANSGDGTGDANAQSWSAWAMSFPLGRWLVGGVGVGFLIYGLLQIVRAFKADLDKRLRLFEMPAEAVRAVVTVSRIGVAARGVVFGIIGTFLAQAAYHENPHEARGIGGALMAVQRQPYGPWLLVIVAFGLIAYGVYQLVRARYRQISAS